MKKMFLFPASKERLDCDSKVRYFHEIMTYILGLKQPAINAIIADARVSWTTVLGRRHGENNALKTGLLFPGCIFGRIGNEEESRRFLLSFKSHINGVTDTVEGFWSRFSEHANSYDFPPARNGFELLISNRASGVPEFYKLNSQRGLSQDRIDHENYIVTFGSGKDILDDNVLTAFTPRLKRLQEYLLEKKVPKQQIRLVTPYFLCLWLSELSLTFESSILESQGVGGAFHFVYQLADLDSQQSPAIYIFSSADRNTRRIYSWCYKVAYPQGGLYIEKQIPPEEVGSLGTVELNCFFDPVTRPDVVAMDTASLQESIRREVDSLPFYFFCGFGFTPPEDRTTFGFVVSTKGKKEDIFDSNGELLREFKKLISHNFEIKRDSV